MKNDATGHEGIEKVSEDAGKAKHPKSPQIKLPLSERAAVTPNEFAGLFGKQTVWGYRQIYAGKVKVIKTVGRMMIPQSEIKRLMASAEVYA